MSVQTPIAGILTAVAAVATSAVIAVALLPSMAAAVVGYTLSTLVAFGAVFANRAVDVRRREQPRYVARRWAEKLSTAGLVLGIVVAVPHVWSIATALSK